jgi:hypothetical protein
MSFNAHPWEELSGEAIKAHLRTGVWTSSKPDKIAGHTTNVCILFRPLAFIMPIMSLPRLIRKHDPESAP